jgi:cytochrome c biogenesis protein
LSILRQVFKALTSLRLGIAAMVALAVLSLVGATIPQGGDRGFYVQTYGGIRADIIMRLDLDHVFRADYYTVLLVFLCVMVFGCSLRSLPQRRRLATRKRFIFEAQSLGAMPNTGEAVVEVDAEEAELHVVEICKHRLYGAWRCKRGSLRAVFASKMGFSRYGSFILHLSFIFLLAGGIATTRFGTRSYHDVTIGDEIAIEESQARTVRVAVEDFTIELDERDRISDYVCKVSVLVDDEVVLRHRIRPNHPLKYAGSEVYLVSYADDVSRPEGFVVSVYDPEGMLIVPHLFAPLGEAVYVEELGLTVEADIGVVPSLRIATDDGRIETHLVKPDASEVGRGSYSFVLIHAIPSLVVTLEVVGEPGQWLIISGLVLLTVGTFISLYLSHRRIWFIVAALSPSQSKVVMGGRANRNMEAFAREFDLIGSQLRELS